MVRHWAGHLHLQQLSIQTTLWTDLRVPTVQVRARGSESGCQEVCRVLLQGGGTRPHSRWRWSWEELLS